MKERRIYRSKAIALVLISALVVTLLPASFASAKAMKLSFEEAGALPGAYQNDGKFYSSQGFAFDTATKVDAYALTLNNDRSEGTLTHMKYEDGDFSEVKSLTYKKNQIGHANDLTVYTKGSNKYIFVARGGVSGGGVFQTAGMIKLSDFENDKAKVYNIKLKNINRKSGKDIRGITYVGKKKVAIKVTVKKKGKKKKVTKKYKKDVFIVQAGRRLNKMYLKSIKGNTVTLQGLDNQRIQAPKIGKREGTANGICYHNGYIYCAYADEGKGGKKQDAMIDSIGYSKLFATKNSNKAVKFKYTFKKKFANDQNNNIFVTESVSFPSLEGKDNMFMTCNGGKGSNHCDFIYKSNQKR